MEVHAHTHTARKKWTHYLWEFLMLFLAVFCGFLAENQLEHFVEHQREIKFIKTLSEDIQADIADLNKGIVGFGLFNRHMDSLILLLKDNRNMEKNAKPIYQQAVWVHYYYKITYYDRTIEQLRSSGSFRLIRNKNVSQAIMEYDGGMNNLLEMQNLFVFQNKEKMLDLSNGVFKTSVAKIWLTKEDWSWHETELPEAPYFLTTEKATIDRFVNQLYQYSMTTARFIGSIRNWALIKATRLDSLIKKEYDIK